MRSDTSSELLGSHPHQADHAVVYDDVFATGRCQHLLGDCIALADHYIADIAPVRQLVAGICGDLHRCVEATARFALLAECVPALHAHRIRRGGRLDRWYAPDATLGVGPTRLSVTDLATYEIVANDIAYRLDLPAIIEQARQAIRPNSKWTSAVTQGDPTEPNIAYPRLWLDFEYAGRNILAAEAANLLWYLLAMGGWLVPRYQPEVYRRTLRYALPPLVTPAAARLRVSRRHRRIDIDTRWQLGPGRATAINTVYLALRGRLGQLCAYGQPDLMSALRPFLVCRILGVIRLSIQDGTDAALCLAKLAQVQDPHSTLDDFLSDLVPSCGIRCLSHRPQSVAVEDRADSLLAEGERR